jgi:hypothetical protein
MQCQNPTRFVGECVAAAMALYGCVVVGGMGDLGLRLGPHATIIGAFGLGYRKVERYMLTLGREAGFGWPAGWLGWGAVLESK